MRKKSFVILRCRLKTLKYQSLVNIKKSDKAPFIIYAVLEYLIEQIDGCKNNPENSSTTKVGEHVSSGFSMSTISSFKSIRNKHNVCRGKDCMTMFPESLKEYAAKIIKKKKKKMKLLTNKQQKSYKIYTCTCIKFILILYT